MFPCSMDGMNGMESMNDMDSMNSMEWFGSTNGDEYG